ncbi:MAG: hypothetical protein IAA72_09435 [Spirochaetes bacterium]|uniref:Right handed beta helix domain-containing protein n=1 Tax=Candidatus Ornithospirochaeta stercoravium TaxID=2840897 RepID=A0A9D9IDY8_9SPIO|nr:hypothetical protein [Candidatus Ornithospirochaeta stercoravium]
MRKAVKAVITIAVLLLMFTSCQQRYIIPMPPINSGNDSKPSVEIPETPEIPNDKVTTETTFDLKDKTFSDLKSWLENEAVKKAEVIKINGNGATLNLAKEEKITLNNQDLILENLTIKGSAPENGTDDTGIQGIVIPSDQSKEVNLYFKDVTIKDFGHGISSGYSKDFYDTNLDSIKLTNIYIIDSTFENCLKGIYINNLGTLQVFNSTFTKIGTESDEGDDSTTRSGSAFDINQFAKGGDIVIYDSTFTDCGNAGTSGAIKIKVRGGDQDAATDVPKNQTGSLESVLIQDCKFNNNKNGDLVLGTGSAGANPQFTYPETLAAKTKIINSTLKVVDKSGHGYEIKNNVLSATETDTKY